MILQGNITDALAVVQNIETFAVSMIDYTLREKAPMAIKCKLMYVFIVVAQGQLEKLGALKCKQYITPCMCMLYFVSLNGIHKLIFTWISSDKISATCNAFERKCVDKYTLYLKDKKEKYSHAC